jgi:methylated-DNA-protein-cysteine methyltransferase-like protein
MPSSYDKIYTVVKKIPHGRVATYGQIARLIGIPRHARQVGYALNALNDNNVPWHRVINAKGEISSRSNPDYENLQKILLEEEGVTFDKDGRISLTKYLWKPDKI